MAERYPTDLTDEQWALAEPVRPPAKGGGRPRTVDLRLVLDTIVYLDKGGCQWAVIPTDLAKRLTAHDCFAARRRDGTWKAVMDALRRQVRVAAGPEPEPSKAAVDTQTVQGSEAGGPRGYDGGKKVNDRERHPVADTLGLPAVVMVAAADADDGPAAPAVLARLTPADLSRLDEVRGDGKYNNRAPDRYSAASGATYEFPLVGRPGPRGWCCCRTGGWPGGRTRGSGRTGGTARTTSGTPGRRKRWCKRRRSI